MKTHALKYPVLSDDSGRAVDPGASQALSALLPGVRAGADPASGDFILLDASFMTPSPTTETVPAARTERLVVLIPENELDEAELARRIWRMAAPGALEVLLMSITPEPGTEAYLHLRLATLASLVRDERVKAGSAFAAGKDWVEAVGRVWRPGDLLVCLQAQQVPGRLRAGFDPGTQLSEALGAPVYFINGLDLGPSLRQIRRRKEWIAWTGFLGTLAGFGLIQLQIQRAMVGNLWTFFMVLSVLAEIAFLWEINEHTQ